MEAFSGETENSGERVPKRGIGSNHAASPQQETENRIVWNRMQELGISCGGAQDGWRQPTGRWRSEGQNLAPQVGLEPTTLRLTAECSTIELLRNNRGATSRLNQTPFAVSNVSDVRLLVLRAKTTTKQDESALFGSVWYWL